MVEVALRRDGDDLTLDVSDNGPGIPSDLGDRIFDPFVTTKAEGVGTGLGLAISRRLAASMGGSLEAGPSTLGGARLTFRVPLEKPCPAPPVAPEAVVA